MNVRGLPGMLAPTYHEFACGKSVIDAASSACCIQPASASSVGSIWSKPCARRYVKASATKSTCCSIDTAMFDSTEGLWGPAMRKRLGNPSVVSPR